MNCKNCGIVFHELKTENGKNRYFCSDGCAKIFYSRTPEKPEVNLDKFNELLEIHTNTLDIIRKKIKTRLFGVPEGTHNDLFESVKEQGKILCLINSRCACEKCGTEDRLTVHHLLTRRVKNFMEFNRYLTQRYFFANIVTLCIDCHTEFHQNEKDWNEKLEPISFKLLEDLKKEFFL